MAGRLEKKVALITGSTSGCGRACAVRFAAEGARVMVTGRNEEAGEEIVRTIRQAGGEASFFRADISKESEVSDLVDATVDVFGGLDVLVNNAVPSAISRSARPLASAWEALTRSSRISASDRKRPRLNSSY